MNIQNLFKNILYRQPHYTEKLDLRDHDKLGFDWLLQGIYRVAAWYVYKPM